MWEGSSKIYLRVSLPLTIQLTCRAACNALMPRETKMANPVRCSVLLGGPDLRLETALDLLR